MYTIDSQKCTGCEKCLEVCPVGAIYMVDNKAQIDDNLCTECGACVEVCNKNAIGLANVSVQQAPVAQSASVEKQPVKSALKSAVMAVGSTLFSIGISKLGELISSKLENSSRTPSTSGRSSSPGTSNSFKGRGGRGRQCRGGGGGGRKRR